MIIAFDTGWQELDAHWLLALPLRRLEAFGFNELWWGSAQREDIANTWFPTLPDWGIEGNWGSFYAREDIDGFVCIVVRTMARADVEQRAVVIASDETYWIKIMMELRGR